MKATANFGGSVFFFGEIVKWEYLMASVFILYNLLYVVAYIHGKHTHWHFRGAWISDK